MGRENLSTQSERDCNRRVPTLSLSKPVHVYPAHAAKGTTEQHSEQQNCDKWMPLRIRLRLRLRLHQFSPYKKYRPCILGGTGT